MAEQRAWSKSSEKRWRASFTRENREGARLLSYKMRHGATPASLIKGEKAAHLAKESRDDNEVRRLSRMMVLDAIPKMGAAKAGVEFFFPQEKRDWKKILGATLCSLGLHKWIDAHKMIMGRAAGMEIRCNRCDVVKK